MSERQEKRAQFKQEKKRTPFVLIAVGLVAAAAVSIFGWKSAAGGGAYPTVAVENGVVAIPAAQLSDGKARYFSYRNGDATINFFLLRSDDGVIRAAFDACDVCFHAKKGYRQEGELMVCNNCDMKFRSDMINEVKGGCNPAPIARTVTDGRVVIAAADLEQGKRYFPIKR